MDDKEQKYICPVSTTIQLICGKYKSFILWHLISRTMRFSDLKRRLPDVTPKMLTQQLRELENDKLVIRTVYPVVPPKVEYSLTDKGRSLRPILEAMFDWGTSFLEEEGLKANCLMIPETTCRDCSSKKYPSKQ